MANDAAAGRLWPCADGFNARLPAGYLKWAASSVIGQKCGSRIMGNQLNCLAQCQTRQEGAQRLLVLQKVRCARHVNYGSVVILEG